MHFNFRRVNENEDYVKKFLPIKDNRSMAKVFGNATVFSGVVSLMKSRHVLSDPNSKYPMMVLRSFLFANSYLINHRIPDLKKSSSQVRTFYLDPNTVFGSKLIKF